MAMLNVSQAKQTESCRNVTVTGMITSYSTSYKVVSKSEWICQNLTCNLQGSETYNPPLLMPIEKYDNTRGFDPACPKCKSTTFTVNHTYHNARSIQLEDVNKTAEEESIDRLEVVVYDDAASHVAAGEVVEITGDIYIQRKSDSGGIGKTNKKLVTVLHGNKIKYKNKEKVVITQKDIDIFYMHKQICEEAYRRELEAAARLNDGALTEGGHKIVPMKYVDRLVAMFAPNVIGYNDVKLGLLRSLVGGRTDHGDDNGRRGRIPTLLIGDKGTAKTLLAMESTKLNPNSRFVNAQNTSGKSLIGVVDKENDGGLFLRLGPVVLAKGAVCAINEIGSMAMQDQGHLTDIEEEGKTTLVKYSISFELDAPTTIIATANQYNTEWERVNSVSKDEFPILKTLVDRIDQIYAFRDAPSFEELEDYVKQKTKIRRRRSHNYNFLKKLVLYAKTTIKPEITAESEYRLNKFWTEARLKGVASNRTYDAIFRLAEAQAKLNLSYEVDDNIVGQIMQSLSLMLSQYGEIVRSVESPKHVVYNAFLNVLRQTKAPLSVKELHKIVCDENKQISDYLGSVYNIRDNHKLRVVVDMLLNHGSIKQIQDKPIVIQWLSDTSDASDAKTNSVNDSDHMKSQIGSPRSPGSLTTYSNTESLLGKEHEQQEQLPDSIYRLGHSDLFACKNCTVKGDKWLMMKHPPYCRRTGAN